MTHILLTLCLLALAGCAAPERQPLEKPLLLWLKAIQPGDCPERARACVGGCNHNICTLYLPADTWLDCLAHEARHANEGAWHGGAPTDCGEY